MVRGGVMADELRRLAEQRRAQRDARDARVLGMLSDARPRVHGRDVAELLRCDQSRARSWLDSMALRGLLVSEPEPAPNGRGRGVTWFRRAST